MNATPMRETRYGSSPNVSSVRPQRGIATDVEHGRETLMGADRPHLDANRVGQLFGEIGIPGAGEADRLREDDGLPRHQPGADLLVDDRGDPEARLLDEMTLDRVREPRRALAHPASSHPRCA